MGVQGQAVKAGFYTQPGSTTAGGATSGVGKELEKVETAIINFLAKNADDALKLEREALAFDCLTRYHQQHLALLTDPKQDLTFDKTRERNELLKFLCQEIHLTEQAAVQKSHLAGLDEAHKVIAANLAKFKGVDATLERLPEKQNVIGLPIFRERLQRSLSAQDEVKSNRANHKGFVQKVATDKVQLTDELKAVHHEHEGVEREHTMHMLHKVKLEDVCAHRKEVLGELDNDIQAYKQSVDELMVDYGNTTTQFHGGPASSMRHIVNPDNIIVA